MTRILDVWWDQRLVGQLTQNQHGELGFAYATEWVSDDKAQPLSASLPKRTEPFSRRECRPFFGGLLPEESQRDAAAQALGVSRGNDFALLDRLGGDVAGALQLLPPGEVPPDPVLDQRSSPLDDAGLIRILDALPIRPLLAGEDGLRLSLAGAQSKVPVVLVDGEVALPAPGQPTTHILKPPISRFNATTENEAFVMRLAAAIGLNVAPVQPRVVRDRTFLLVKRYERGGEGYVSILDFRLSIKKDLFRHYIQYHGIISRIVDGSGERVCRYWNVEGVRPADKCVFSYFGDVFGGGYGIGKC